MFASFLFSLFNMSSLDQHHLQTIEMVRNRISFVNVCEFFYFLYLIRQVLANTTSKTWVEKKEFSFSLIFAKYFICLKKVTKILSFAFWRNPKFREKKSLLPSLLEAHCHKAPLWSSEGPQRRFVLPYVLYQYISHTDEQLI